MDSTVVSEPTSGRQWSAGCRETFRGNVPLTIWKGFGSHRKVLPGIKVESAPRSRNSGLDTRDSAFGYIAEAHDSGDIWPCLDQITIAVPKYKLRLRAL